MSCLSDTLLQQAGFLTKLPLPRLERNIVKLSLDDAADWARNRSLLESLTNTLGEVEDLLQGNRTERIRFQNNCHHYFECDKTYVVNGWSIAMVLEKLTQSYWEVDRQLDKIRLLSKRLQRIVGSWCPRGVAVKAYPLPSAIDLMRQRRKPAGDKTERPRSRHATTRESFRNLWMKLPGQTHD